MNIHQATEANKKKDISLAYDCPSWWYDMRGYLILRLTYRSKLKPLLAFFIQNLSKNHLEAAVGSGTFLHLLLKQTKSQELNHINAFDYAPNMLAGAFKRFSQMPNIKIINADVTSLPYSANSFDSINVANAIHCFSDISKAFKELFRVSKIGGTLAGNVLLHPAGNVLSRSIATHINSWGMTKGVLYKPYSVAEIKEIITQAGFMIINEHITGNMYLFTAKKL